jgi:hypothetical protein
MIVGIGGIANISPAASARRTAPAWADRLFAQREQAKPARGPA